MFKNTIDEIKKAETAAKILLDETKAAAEKSLADYRNALDKKHELLVFDIRNKKGEILEKYQKKASKQLEEIEKSFQIETKAIESLKRETGKIASEILKEILKES